MIRGLAASRDTCARLSILRFDGKFARYEMSLKEKAVQHIVLDMEKSSSARASEAEVDCTADSSDRSGALGAGGKEETGEGKA